MEEFFEELLGDVGELEEVEKMFRCAKFAFPVVYFGSSYCCFNMHCMPLIGEYVRWFVSPEYVIGLPGSATDDNAFKVSSKRYPHSRVFSTTFPSALRNEKRISKGYYKLYKYKTGFAFKRYEQVGKNNIKN